MHVNNLISRDMRAFLSENYSSRTMPRRFKSHYGIKIRKEKGENILGSDCKQYANNMKLL